MKIALLGPALTYTDIVCDQYLKKKSVQKTYCRTIREVIELVSKGKVDQGIIPIENTTYGTVRETEDNLFRYHPKIIFSFATKIHQNLVAKKNTNTQTKGLRNLTRLKGTFFKDIKLICSHQQAIEQCENFIRKTFPKAEKIIFNSTVQAIEYVANAEGNNLAAIGPISAAKKYHLTVLKKNIEDAKNNKTTFIVIQKKEVQPSMKNIRTSIVFWFGKDQPGTLHQVLSIFADQKVNLSKIESRPAPKNPGNYLFFLDYDGDEKILRKVKNITSGLISFGTYEYKNN